MRDVKENTPGRTGMDLPVSLGNPVQWHRRIDFDRKRSFTCRSSRTLQSRGIPHALIDTDELDRVWPKPEPVDALIAASQRNLQVMWATFFQLGVRRLVLSGVMASIQQSRSWLEEAISGSTITFVRLTADRDTRERRLRGREVGSGFVDEMQASDRAVEMIRKLDLSGTPVIVTDSKGVGAIAEEVLRVVGWI